MIESNVKRLFITLFKTMSFLKTQSINMSNFIEIGCNGLTVKE